MRGYLRPPPPRIRTGLLRGSAASIPPGDRSVHAARNVGDLGITGIGSNDAEFLVLWLQQVLPHYLHFQPFPWPPAQSQVHADVAWDLDGRQRVDIAGHQVELDAASQVPCRAE